MDRQYAAYHIKELGVNVNGEQTLDENIADNAGVKIGYNAYGNTVKIKNIKYYFIKYGYIKFILYFIIKRKILDYIVYLSK